MNLAQLRQKLPSRPKLAEHVQHWGLPKERLFPLDNVGLVKMAAEAFESQIENMTPSQRLVASRNICARAEELGVPGVESTLAYKYAGAQLSPHFSTFIALRKEASAHMADDELEKLVEVATIIDARSDVNNRIEGLDKVAAALEDFDRRHGLAGGWGYVVPDPSYTTFGLTVDPAEQVEFVVKVGGFQVRAQDFDDVDWSRVEGKLPAEVVEGMRDANDKLAVFASLPDPEKEIIYQSLFLG